MTRPTCVVLVGPSGAGKSTLARAARSSGLPIDVPARYVTRPPRDGDRDDENVFLSPDEFEARAPQMALHWQRQFEGGRVERYGFPRTARFPLYSANDALLEQELPGALIVAVDAPREVREARLRARSPEAWKRAPGELAWRLEHQGPSPRAHVVIANHGAAEADAPAAFVRLLATTLT